MKINDVGFRKLLDNPAIDQVLEMSVQQVREYFDGDNDDEALEALTDELDRAQGDLISSDDEMRTILLVISKSGTVTK